MDGHEVMVEETTVGGGGISSGCPAPMNDVKTDER